jgi:hypothetical protein
VLSRPYKKLVSLAGFLYGVDEGTLLRSATAEQIIENKFSRICSFPECYSHSSSPRRFNINPSNNKTPLTWGYVIGADEGT